MKPPPPPLLLVGSSVGVAPAAAESGTATSGRHRQPSMSALPQSLGRNPSTNVLGTTGRFSHHGSSAFRIPASTNVPANRTTTAHLFPKSAVLLPPPHPHPPPPPSKTTAMMSVGGSKLPKHALTVPAGPPVGRQRIASAAVPTRTRKEPTPTTIPAATAAPPAAAVEEEFTNKRKKYAEWFTNTSFYLDVYDHEDLAYILGWLGRFKSEVHTNFQANATKCVVTSFLNEKYQTRKKGVDRQSPAPGVTGSPQASWGSMQPNGILATQLSAANQEHIRRLTIERTKMPESAILLRQAKAQGIRTISSDQFKMAVKRYFADENCRTIAPFKTANAQQTHAVNLSRALLQEKISGRQREKPKYYEFKHSYVLIEDVTEVHRPIFKEYNAASAALMQLNQDPITLGGCPFYHPATAAAHGKSSAKLGAKDGSAGMPTDATAKAAKVEEQKRILREKHETSIRLLAKSHAEIKKFCESRKQQKPQTVEKKPGYCECCLAKYSDLEDHVVSAQHQSFANTSSHFHDLDALLEKLARPKAAMPPEVMYARIGTEQGMPAVEDAPEQEMMEFRYETLDGVGAYRRVRKCKDKVREELVLPQTPQQKLEADKTADEATITAILAKQSSSESRPEGLEEQKENCGDPREKENREEPREDVGRSSPQIPRRKSWYQSRASLVESQQLSQTIADKNGKVEAEEECPELPVTPTVPNRKRRRLNLKLRTSTSGETKTSATNATTTTEPDTCLYPLMDGPATEVQRTEVMPGLVITPKMIIASTEHDLLSGEVNPTIFPRDQLRMVTPTLLPVLATSERRPSLEHSEGVGSISAVRGRGRRSSVQARASNRKSLSGSRHQRDRLQLRLQFGTGSVAMSETRRGQQREPATPEMPVPTGQQRLPIEDVLSISSGNHTDAFDYNSNSDASYHS